MARKKLNQQDHEKIGNAIKSIRLATMELHRIACATYGKNSSVAKAIRNSTDRLSLAKSRLAESLIEEFPDAPEAKIYFGETKLPAEFESLREIAQ